MFDFYIIKKKDSILTGKFLSQKVRKSILIISWQKRSYGSCFFRDLNYQGTFSKLLSFFAGDVGGQ